MAEATTTVDGLRIAYSDHGHGAEVLLLHGNPESRHSWQPVFDELGHGYRLIAPDFPGFGDSDPWPHQVELGPELMARFWERFVEVVVPNAKPHVVVHDFGGPWLLPWVAAHPERVRSLFVINSIFHRDFPWHKWARVWQQPVLGELAIFGATRGLLRRELARHAPRIPPKVVDAMYDRMHPTMRRTLLRSYRAYANSDTVFDPWETRLLEAIKDRPVRVVWGDRDPYIAPSFADRFGVQATRFSEYGHWIHLEAPALVAREMLEFWS